MLGSTKLILLSNGAMSDHCFPLSESYQLPRVPVCKEERALGLLRTQLWPMPLVIKMLGELSKADTSLIASRLLYFYKNVHAVQSGCMDHKWNKKIRIQLQSKKGKPSAIYLCMAPVSLPKVHGFKHGFPKQSRSQDIFCATAGHIWNAEMGVFAVRPKGLFLGQKGTQN